MKMYCNVCNKYRKFKNTKCHVFFKKIFLLFTANIKHFDPNKIKMDEKM